MKLAARDPTNEALPRLRGKDSGRILEGYGNKMISPLRSLMPPSQNMKAKGRFSILLGPEAKLKHNWKVSQNELITLPISFLRPMLNE
ncbi:hypothetical protein HAX54_031987 [Datura stramonium]|uniref:Uncharacterized protein n=1 Tax=Datura stramonium TaxID=4076 RepID=A0ABS8SCG9_DATST|nr:hypothetical protein [Datura stramonium]